MCLWLIEGQSTSVVGVVRRVFVAEGESYPQNFLGHTHCCAIVSDECEGNYHRRNGDSQRGFDAERTKRKSAGGVYPDCFGGCPHFFVEKTAYGLANV